MAIAESSVQSLCDTQQTDGGWAYVAGSSWTEPTCYALIALRAAGASDLAIRRGCEWLVRRQRRDGGWSPGPAVEHSTHVTSLAILALSLPQYDTVTSHAVHWLLRQSGAESSFWARLARSAMGTQSPATQHQGWPWWPGSSAWVIPTSLSILALARRQHAVQQPGVAARIADARAFLLSRRCPDHGWNHGGLYRTGEMPFSYPETTGLALLALCGSATPELDPSLRCGEQHYRDPRSGEGAHWLRIGLMAHGRDPGPPPAKYRQWTANHAALEIILQAAEAGYNPFLGHA